MKTLRAIKLSPTPAYVLAEYFPSVIMKPAIAKRLLNSISILATRPLKRKRNTSRQLVADLEYILTLINRNRCSCGRGWQRGGNRQGAYLCQQCWEEDGR